MYFSFFYNKKFSLFEYTDLRIIKLVTHNVNMSHKSRVKIFIFMSFFAFSSQIFQENYSKFGTLISC